MVQEALTGTRPPRDYEALIPSHKKEMLRYFAGLKSPEAARNLEGPARAVRQERPVHGAIVGLVSEATAQRPED